MVLLMASEDVKTSESAVSTIVNLAEEVKLTRGGVKGPESCNPQHLQDFGRLGSSRGRVVPSIAVAFATYKQVKDILGVEIRIRN